MMGKTTFYESCPNVIEGPKGKQKCQKKLVDMNNGMYDCMRCQKQCDSADNRMFQSVLIADETKETWCTVFQDEAEKMLRSTVDELKMLKEANQDKTSIKTNIIAAEELKPVEAGRKLLDLMKLYIEGGY
jgi:hypothetical protein